jgi:hypothetical protein
MALYSMHSNPWTVMYNTYTALMRRDSTNKVLVSWFGCECCGLDNGRIGVTRTMACFLKTRRWTGDGRWAQLCATGSDDSEELPQSRQALAPDTRRRCRCRFEQTKMPLRTMHTMLIIPPNNLPIRPLLCRHYSLMVNIS